MKSIDDGMRMETIWITSKMFLVQVCLFVAIVGSIWGAQNLYSWVDETAFPDIHKVEQVQTEEERGILVVDTILHRMKYELDSSFGWSANDILFCPSLLDNRAYRQYGVYNATKPFMDFFSTDMAKLGNSARENDFLYKARMNYFAISPSRWGIAFIPSAEGSYKDGISLVEKYKKELCEGKAVYNTRPDDVYNIFNLMLSDRMLGYAIGLLQDSQNDPFYKLDNKVYEVQGMVLVLRDVFNAMYVLYPDAVNKGNEENFKKALMYMDNICTYDPLLVTKTFNSSELVLSWLLFARNRINDIKESIRI